MEEEESGFCLVNLRHLQGISKHLCHTFIIEIWIQTLLNCARKRKEIAYIGTFSLVEEAIHTQA